MTSDKQHERMPSGSNENFLYRSDEINEYRKSNSTEWTKNPPGKPYLAYFATKNIQFRIPELESIAKLYEITFFYEPPTASELSTLQTSPYLIIYLPDDESAKKIASRSIGLHGVFEIWSSATDYPSLEDSLRSFVDKNHAYVRSMIDDCHFKFIVKSYGHHYTSAQKVEIINRFSWMYWTGKVDLEHPEQIFWILEYVDVNKLSNAPLPRQIWFTRQISRGCRHLVNKYSLSNRKYLGTTSMEAEIAFLSANQALARPGSLILDPFVGTGSLIVACAHFRAYTIGTDIDRKVLDGLSADECIESNFAQYNLTQQFLGCIQLDMSFFNALYLGRSRFDAIICDPPYGIRAGARKIGVRPQRELRHKNRGTDPAPIHVNPNDPNWLPHVPQCIAYHIEDVLKDLVELAANLLVLHGRLVYWLPTTKEYSQSDLPTHPCLLLISDSEQKLTMNWSRRLITMEKISDYKPSLSKPNPRHNLPTHANIAFKVLKDPSRCRKVELSEE